MTVVPDAAEEARATLVTLFPEGFEEREDEEAIEFAAYTDGAGEQRLRSLFDDVASSEVKSGWEDQWRAFHRPVRVRSVWIGPPWVEAPRDVVAVVIDPGRAFGTGAHATTRLCLELLQEQPHGSVLDVGSGSGVLAIAAAKLGFGPVIAVDHDGAAVEATRANAERNGVSIDAVLGDASTDALPRADVVLANLEAGLVRALAPGLECRALISSGYYWSEREQLPGFRHLIRRRRERWAADLYESERDASY